MPELALTINGKSWTGTVAENRTLADFLRSEVVLTGTRIACDHAVCGACTVLLDGFPVAACAIFAFQAAGRAISTIEGLEGPDGGLHPIQQAFLANGAFQCGFCASGMILLAKALLDTNPHPDRQEIIRWMSANVCRCTGYSQIVDAVADCAKE
jgi:aerobic carbon-monoxide dehydrogenase small subunit